MIRLRCLILAFLSLTITLQFFFLLRNHIHGSRENLRFDSDRNAIMYMDVPRHSPSALENISVHNYRLAGQSIRNGCPGKWNVSSSSQKTFVESCKSKINSADICRRFGTAYGGHEMPYPLCWLKPGDIYYGFGCGEDISFDISLADAYALTVRLFDPTPRAVGHVKAVMSALYRGEIPVLAPALGHDKYYHEGLIQEISGGVNAKAWFEKIILSNVKSSQIVFHPWALAIKNGSMSFFEPTAGVSHSLLKSKQTEGKKFSVVARELSSIMAELKDDKISVLKIDIEGYEIVLIPELVKLFRSWKIRQWPRVLLFDMDSMRPHHGHGNRIEGQKCVQLLVDAGYDVFSSRDFDYTFVLKTHAVDSIYEI